MNKGKGIKGIALISVLFIAAVVLILASTFIFTIVRERQSTNATRLVSDSLQTADAVSERARLEVVGTFYETFKQSPDFVREVYALLPNSNGGSTDAALRAKLVNENLMTTKSLVINGKQGYWRITGATTFDGAGKQTEHSLYITVSATAQTATGVQTVIRRINMGESQIFDLAMLARDTNCIYCHLRVNGDVGSLGDLQPGWDTRTGPQSGGDYGGSVVNGEVYIAGLAGVWSGKVGDANRTKLDNDTNLATDPNTINGARFTQINENFNGEPLPQQDGANAFPAISRDVAQTAKGSVSGGTVYTVDIGGTLSGVPTASNVTELKGKQNKNVVLIGTKDNPIVLNGDVYFDGDVVIQGYVKGRGAIYSDRNVYVAGNVQYSDPPSCKNATNKDACAQTAINDKKDELRLGARGNIVLGDYTEVTTTGERKPWQGLQAADYYRDQFGFNSTTATRCYDKETGDELEPFTVTSGSSTTTEYRTIEGKPISNPVCVPQEGDLYQDAYSYSMRPGRIDPSDGGFDSWLSDGLYQSILGQETRKYDSWRFNVADQAPITAAEIDKQFAKYNLSATSKEDILAAMTSTTGQWFDVTNQAGDTIGRIDWDGNTTIRVTMDAAYSYEKQTTKVDAFLYSNQRIAGKTFSAPLTVNGGMISEEIGVLAPGLTRLGYLDAPRYNFLNSRDCTSQDYIKDNFATVPNPTTAQIEASYAYQPESDDCALTINYDYRLRNGGLGFNLIALELGQTLSWRIGDKKEDQVRP